MDRTVGGGFHPPPFSGGWEYFGTTVSRSGDEPHRIDRHAGTGSLRCDCKSFRWAKAPKRCFHTDAAEQEIDAEARGEAHELPQSVAQEALDLTRRMLQAGGVVLPPARLLVMARILEPRLANGPVRGPVDAGAAVAGQRMIEVE